jgi:hypothetical protein
MALREEAWNAATLDDTGKALRTKADCSDCRGSGLEVRRVDDAKVEAVREAICLVGAAAKACRSIVDRAIEAMVCLCVDVRGVDREVNEVHKKPSSVKLR